MPIHNMHYENQLFFTRQEGYVDNVDGRMWATALKNHARTADQPVIAVVDITATERLCPTLVKTIGQTLNGENIAGIVFIAGDNVAGHSPRVMGKLAALHHVHVVTTQEDAHLKARSLLSFPGIAPANTAFARANPAYAAAF
jgi:hypothetical protein